MFHSYFHSHQQRTLHENIPSPCSGATLKRLFFFVLREQSGEAWWGIWMPFCSVLEITEGEKKYRKFLLVLPDSWLMNIQKFWFYWIFLFFNDRMRPIGFFFKTSQVVTAHAHNRQFIWHWRRKFVDMYIIVWIFWAQSKLIVWCMPNQKIMFDMM